MKTFESRNNDIYTMPMLNVSGLFVVDGDAAETFKGMICAKGSRTESKAFTGIKNRGTYEMTAATATTTELYVCDPHYTDLAPTSNGENVFAGANTLELTIPAGYEMRYEKLVPGMEYVFGDGNFSTAPTISEGAITTKYATVAAGMLVATATKPTSGVYFEITDAMNFTEGTRIRKGFVVCLIKA